MAGNHKTRIVDGRESRVFQGFWKVFSLSQRQETAASLSVLVVDVIMKKVIKLEIIILMRKFVILVIMRGG